MSQLYPLIFGSERKNRRVVAACVEVICTRSAFAWWPISSKWTAGTRSIWEPTCRPRALCKQFVERKADILAISVTLLTHLAGCLNSSTRCAIAIVATFAFS